LRELAWLPRAAGVLAVAAAPHNAAAIEPIVRTGTPKFKFSLAAYSYRDLLNAKPPKLTLEDFLGDSQEGLESTELTSYYFPKTSLPSFSARSSKRVSPGVDISGTAVGNDFAIRRARTRQSRCAT